MASILAQWILALGLHGQGEAPQAAPEPDFARERALLDASRAAVGRSDYVAARAQAAEVVEVLLAWPEEERGTRWLPILSRSGAAAWEAQDARTAHRAWNVVFEIRSRTLPPDHHDLQTIRADLANALRTLGDLHGSRAHLEAALEVLTRTLPEDHADLQMVRGNLAGTLKALGDLEGALTLEEQVLEVRSRTLHPDDPDLQRARLNLASTIKALGDLPGARALEEQVLEVRSRTLPPDHPDLALARGNLGTTLIELGDLRRARELAEQVLATRTRTHPPDHPDLQRARLSLASVLRNLGDLQAARALSERALEVRSRTLPADHPDLQRARQSLAVAIKALGDVTGARMLEEQVLEVRSRTLPPEHPDLQLARSNLAVTLKRLGDLETARALEELVLEVRSRTLPPDHPDLQRARSNLAITMQKLGEPLDTRALLQQVLDVWTEKLPEDHPDLQAGRANVAWAIKALGDLAGARRLEEQVLEVRSRTLPVGHPRLASAQEHLAVTIAAEHARSASAARTAHDGGARERCLQLIGSLARSQASDAREAILSSTSREAEARCASRTALLGTVLSFAVGYGALGPLEELLPDAFAFSESTRGAALAFAALAREGASSPRYRELRSTLRERSDELAGLTRKGTTSQEYQAALARKAESEGELLAVARELLQGGGVRFEPEATRLAAALGDGEGAVSFRCFERRELGFTDGTESGDPARPVERQVESLCAFVVRPLGGRAAEAGASQLALVDLGPLERIEAAVGAWREAVGLDVVRGVPVGKAPDDLVRERGLELRALVLDPVLEELGDVRRLVLVPDGVLHLVPFDALPLAAGSRGTDGTLQLVGDLVTIELRNTLDELPERSRAPARPGFLLALGGATFNSAPLGPSADELALAAADEPSPGQPRAVALRGGAWEQGFHPLTYSGLEAREIAALHAEVFEEAGALVLEKRKASRESLTALAPQARWLHVATHGWYAAESIRSWSDAEPLDRHAGLGMRQSGEEQVRGMSPMLLCGLALAGANLPEDAVGRAPGLMTAEELSTLDLSGCELAVLSACDTNVGQRRAGQGVASLQRALQMAGARSAITSLWKVPDEATRELMLDFYRRLWVEGKPGHQALWEAKRRLRDAVDERDAARYGVRDWAAWVLTGEPD